MPHVLPGVQLDLDLEHPGPDDDPRVRTIRSLEKLARHLKTPEGEKLIEEIREESRIAAERLKRDSTIPDHILHMPMTI